MRILLSLLVLTASCWGQQSKPPDAPQPKPSPQTVTDDHTFFDEVNVMTFLTSAVTIGTEAGMSCGQYTSGQPAPTLPAKTCKTIAWGAAATLAGEVGASAILHHTNHHAIERVAPPAALLFHIARMVYISTHRPH